MSTNRKRNRFLNAKRHGTSYKMKPEGNGFMGTHKQGQWEYRPEMNENNPKVALTNEQRETSGPDDPLDRGRMVYVDEIRITSSTQIAGSMAAIRSDFIERYPKSVREQFPGRAAYFVRPIPEGPLPAFILAVALVCYQPTSDTTADSFDVVVSWSSDDLDSNPAELIKRGISDIEWPDPADKNGKGRRPAV
jgi:hypothetical protein